MIRGLRSLALGVALVGCNAGAGTGTVESSHLYVKNCWDGSFDLTPTFFGTTPFGNTQQIRIQHGDRDVEVSDGILLVLEDVAAIRDRMKKGEPIALGLPVGVNPPGFPPRIALDPPLASLTLYLYGTCHVQNGALYAVSGNITFTHLFSGDRNENDAEARRTTASFSATVTDPRSADLVSADGGPATVEYPENEKSLVEGDFDFYFQRGVPAQPFP